MYLKDKMIELKNNVLSYGFGDEAEEIRFFKHQKILVLGRLLYYYKLYQNESNRPPSYVLGLSYYQCEIEKLKTVFERNLPSSSITVWCYVSGLLLLQTGVDGVQLGSRHIPFRAGNGVIHGCLANRNGTTVSLPDETVARICGG